MIAQSPEVKAVVAHFQRMLASNGSTVDVTSVAASVVRVRYGRGDCDTCGLEPAELGAMIEELLVRRGANGFRVEVDEVAPSSVGR